MKMTVFASLILNVALILGCWYWRVVGKQGRAMLLSPQRPAQTPPKIQPSVYRACAIRQAWHYGLQVCT